MHPRRRVAPPPARVRMRDAGAGTDGVSAAPRAPVSGDCGPGFCFVYHEQEKAFVAWGPNSELQLLPIEEEEERV